MCVANYLELSIPGKVLLFFRIVSGAGKQAAGLLADDSSVVRVRNHN